MEFLEDLYYLIRDSFYYLRLYGFLYLIRCEAYLKKVEQNIWITTNAHSRAADEKYEDGKLLLHFAASSSNLEIVKLIFNAYPQAVAEKDKDGQLPLHFAARNSNLEVVKFILDANPEAAAEKDNYDRLPLHEAVCWSNPEVVKFILDAHPGAADEEDDQYQFPLHIAANNPNLEIEVIKLILDANPKAAKKKDIRGWYPLHCAELILNLDIVKMIFDAHPKAIVDKDWEGIFPFRFSGFKTKNFMKVEQFLLKATVRVNRWPLSAKVIQRAWRECRYNPEYNMCEKVLVNNIKTVCPDLLQDLN